MALNQTNQTPRNENGPHIVETDLMGTVWRCSRLVAGYSKLTLPRKCQDYRA